MSSTILPLLCWPYLESLRHHNKVWRVFCLCSALLVAPTMTLAQIESPILQLRTSAALSIVPTPVATSDKLSAQTSASTLSSSVASCTDFSFTPNSPPITLSLIDVMTRMVCLSPIMRQALAGISEQEANLILAQQALRPRFTINGDLSTSQTPATALLGATNARSASLGLAMNWILFDFGARDANTRAARFSLQAAYDSQSQAALQQWQEALRLYIQAQNSQLRLHSLQDAIQTAQRSLDMAQARHVAGVGSLSEKLQAQTALAQTQLNLVKAQTQWQVNRGNLALAIGWSVRQSFELSNPIHDLPSVQLPQYLDPQSPQSLQTSSLSDWDGWLLEIAQDHPRLRGLRAEINALQARLLSEQAQAQGTISLNSSASVSRGLGGTSGASTDQVFTASIQANVPLFEGRSQQARERLIASQISNREAQFESIRRDLENELWRALHDLLAERQNLLSSTTFLSVASQSLEVAMGRYKSGIGSIAELMAAQNARSDAQFQHDSAQLNLLQAHLKLGVATGQMRSAANRTTLISP